MKPTSSGCRPPDGDTIGDHPRKKRLQVKLGTLVLVVGPSGAGKDTLIAAAKRKFHDQPNITFPQRVITRPEGIGEDHLPVSRKEFQQRVRDGAFFLSWQAHGFHYGVTAEVITDLNAGRSVVVNVSRDVVERACTEWRKTQIVQVTVALDALKARLEARGRENQDDIAKRLARASLIKEMPLHAMDLIDNSGHLPTAIRKFNALIARYAGCKAKR